MQLDGEKNKMKYEMSRGKEHIKKIFNRRSRSYLFCNPEEVL